MSPPPPKQESLRGNDGSGSSWSRSRSNSSLSSSAWDCAFLRFSFSLRYSIDENQKKLIWTELSKICNDEWRFCRSCASTEDGVGGPPPPPPSQNAWLSWRSGKRSAARRPDTTTPSSLGALSPILTAKPRTASQVPRPDVFYTPNCVNYHRFIHNFNLESFCPDPNLF